jgi:hypothetical protein
MLIQADSKYTVDMLHMVTYQVSALVISLLTDYISRHGCADLYGHHLCECIEKERNIASRQKSSYIPRKIAAVT